jgi:hypothetical protein
VASGLLRGGRGRGIRMGEQGKDGGESLGERGVVNDPDYIVCPKCEGDGTSGPKGRRKGRCNYSQCSQCGGTGWKYSPKGLVE